MTEIVNPEYLTLKEAAQLMRLSPRTLLRPPWPQKLGGAKVGGRWRVRRLTVVNMLEGRPYG